MTRILKRQNEVVIKAAREGIGRVLKNEYGNLTREVLPGAFTSLLTRLESAERIARNKARLERLRQGLTEPNKQ
jgi:hypothetical protein